MLNVRVDIQGDRVVVAGLQKLADEMPGAVDRGLKRAAIGTFNQARKFLNGPGQKSSAIPGGGWPVPRRTEKLHNSLDFLLPNKSKSKDGITFSTGAHEVIVYNSAEYSAVIHDGLGSSAKFGARPFLTKAFEAFNRSPGIAETIEDEVQKEIKKRGFE